ncbi:MAG: 4-hydroxythreonine-4-phosphate dehydrogenase PdxA [Bacteroidota bacterium]|nr:4-hydroxythreonine-4-phosphate dehydrogenase PdxA [Bacteroidota bacterium]
MKPIIAITMGDHNGIGPEVALKAATSPAIKRICIPVLVGSTYVFEHYAKLLKMKTTLKEIESVPKNNSDAIPIFSIRKFVQPNIKPGILSFEAGRLAIESVISATIICLEKEVDGMVTAPLAKETINFKGFDFPGQSELITTLCKRSKFAMIMLYKNIRVALVTIHISIKEIPSRLTKQLLKDRIQTLNNSLRNDFGIRKPKIAVLGLNPHAGENGVIGEEENEMIIPAMKQANIKGIDIHGPFPADGFFGVHAYKNYDAVLAMYHDQGLIPIKLLGFEEGVNFTAGLPIVRTSPDHGTAFDIAGKGRANPSSTIEAIKTAVAIINNRRKNKK